MSQATLEHANITVTDPKAFAAVMEKLFDWKIRWEGGAINDGYTIHVGNETDYLAVYAPPSAPVSSDITDYMQKGGLNHVGVVVDDLDGTEQKVIDAGFETHNHADYEPGRRFYFNGPDGIEFEVVSYD